jgi:SlyX protein
VNEQRLIEIETRLAHQDRLLGDLDLALTSQQAQLTRLEQMCQKLIDHMRSMSDAEADEPGDERPPHY